MLTLPSDLTLRHVPVGLLGQLADARNIREDFQKALSRSIDAHRANQEILTRLLAMQRRALKARIEEMLVVYGHMAHGQEED